GIGFQVFTDYPNFHGAWDVDRFTLEHPIEVTSLDDLTVTEIGPQRASVRMTRSFGESRIIQTISLSAGTRRLDFATAVDWHESRRLLKRSEEHTPELQSH